MFADSLLVIDCIMRQLQSTLICGMSMFLSGQNTNTCLGQAGLR